MNSRNVTAWGLVLVGSAIMAYTYWTNPDMTRQRLMIEFWPRYAVAFVMFVAAAGIELTTPSQRTG